MKLLGISGSPSPLSRTNEVIGRVLREAAELRPEVRTELLKLRDYRMEFCDGRPPEAYTGDTRIAIDRVVEADVVVVGSPIYRGSYTGALKNLFDVLPNDALRGKPAGIVATGGSDHHFLALEHQLRPLLAFFEAFVYPVGVYAQNEHFVDGRLADPEVAKQCRVLGQGLVRMAGVPDLAATDSGYPVIHRKPEQQPGR